MPDEALQRLRELLHASVSETPAVLARHVSRTRGLIEEMADETDEERRDLDRFRSDFAYAVLGILEEEADKELLPGCAEALVSMGEIGNTLCLKLMRKRRVAPLELDAMVKDVPVNVRIRSLNRFFLMGREFEASVTTSLFKDLKKLQEDHPDEFLAFLLECVQTGVKVSFPLQKMLLESAFWVWVKRLLKENLDKEQLLYVVEALRGLESPEVAEEAVRLLDRKDEEVLCALLETIGRTGTPGDPALIESVTALFRNKSENVRLCALETLGTLRDPKYHLKFYKFKRAHADLEPRLGRAALRMDGAGFQAMLTAAEPAERMGLVWFMFAVLAGLDGTGWKQILTDTTRCMGLKASSCAGLFDAAASSAKGKGKGSAADKVFKQSKPRKPEQDGTMEKSGPPAAKAEEGSFVDRLKKSETIADAAFAGLKLSKGKFKGKRLRNISLAGARISRTVFKDTVFSHVSFSGAQLEDVVFSGCTFNHVRFDSARIKDSAFDECTLNLCEFVYADLYAVRMASTTATLSTFADASLNSLDMNACLFDACSFRDAHVDGIQGVSISFEAADFSRSDLRRLILRGAAFSESFFTDARIFDMDVRNSSVQGCRAGRALVYGVQGVAPVFLKMEQHTVDFMAGKALKKKGPGPLPDGVFNGKGASLAAKSIAEWFFKRDTAFALCAAETNNRRRLRWALHKIGPAPSMFLRALPMILEADLSEVSEGRVKHTPVEMSDHYPTHGELMIVDKHFKEFFSEGDGESDDSEEEVIRIQGLYTIGSTGTIAHTRSSDLDLWVCCNEDEAGKEAMEKFEDKLAWIEEWAEKKYGLEVHFFPTDIKKARVNDFGFSDEEGAGSSQALLLKEEFYRTALRLAGKVPAWQLVPVGCTKKRYDALVKRYCAGQGVPAEVVIDLGYLGNIPPEEFFGASLWQIVKALKSPFKSAMKFALLDTYTARRKGKKTELVCDRLKAGLQRGCTGFWECDPYALLFKRIADHYQAKGNNDALDLMRMAFLLKTGVGEKDHPPGAAVPHAGNRYAEYYFPSFSLAITGRTTAGDKLKNFSDWTRTGRLVGRYMFNTYERISKNPDFHEGPAITEQDTARLGRRIFSFFGQMENKIMRVPFMNSPRGMFRVIHLYAEKTGTATTAWLARGESGEKGGGKSRTEDIMKERSPLRLLAWLTVNSIYSPDMFIQYDPDLAPVSAVDIENVLKDMYELFPIKRTFYTDLEETLVPERVKRVYVIANFQAHRAEARLVQASILYSTSWGQMFFIPEAAAIKSLANATLKFLKENIKMDIAPEVIIRGFTPEHSKCPKLSFKMI